MVVRYVGNRFIAVGMYGAMISSPDGNTWTKIDSGTPFPITGVAYGNNLYVATAAKTILSSADGVTWTSQEAIYPYSLSGVVYIEGQSTFVVLGAASSGQIAGMLTSSDGTAWAARNPQTTDNLWDCIDVGDRLLAPAGTMGMSSFTGGIISAKVNH